MNINEDEKVNGKTVEVGIVSIDSKRRNGLSLMLLVTKTKYQT
jgi:hypothetical protein